jgi:hypothetical protein
VRKKIEKSQKPKQPNMTDQPKARKNILMVRDGKLGLFGPEDLPKGAVTTITQLTLKIKF